MFDSTASLKSPKSLKQPKVELQSFYHYSKIVKLKELSQKPTQLSINYHSSQHNSSAMRLSDHISNFEFFIQQNSRYNHHRILKEQFSQQLTQKQIDKLNREKHLENQKRIEQSINKFKFNHTLDNPQQSITRRRIIRLSSETSLQSRPVTKQSQNPKLELQKVISKKQSIDNRIEHFQTDLSPKNINFEEIVQQHIEEYIDQNLKTKNSPKNFETEKVDEYEIEQEYEIDEEDEQNEQFQEEEYKFQQQKKTTKQSKKIQDNNDEDQAIQKEQTIRAARQLQQTKKKLKAQISQQLIRKETEIIPHMENMDQKSSKRIEVQNNNELFIKKILEEQQKYKEKQQEIKEQELKQQKERQQELQQFQDNIERIKNKKEDFVYKAEQNKSEEEFIRQQQLLKQQQQLQKQQKEQAEILEQQKKKEEEQKELKKMEEIRNQEIEEKKKKEISMLIQKQKEEIEKKEQEEQAKQPPKIEKQKSVLLIQRQPTILESKRSQEEMVTSARLYKQQMDEQIKKQIEDQERFELESLDFVDFMLKAINIYDTDYQRFKIFDKELKKVQPPPKNLEEDDEQIYYHLKQWKQISKQCSTKIFGNQVVTK